MVTHMLETHVTEEPDATGPTLSAESVGCSADRPGEVSMAGSLIALGPIRHDLQPLYRQWHEARSVLGELAEPSDLLFPLDTPWWDRQEPARLHVHPHPHFERRLEESWFTIYELAGWRPVGNAALVGIDLLEGSAEISLFIGEHWARGRGFGSETARLMLDYAFTALELDSLTVAVSEFDLASQSLYGKAGFQEVDRCRRLRGGVLWNDILMECLAEQFTSPFRGPVR